MSDVTYTFKAEPGEKEKLAPQARIVLNHIKAAGTSGVTRDKLVAALEKDATAGTLETRQDVRKILGFYQPRMVEAGLIDVTKPAKAPKEPKAKAEPKQKTVAEAKPKAQPVSA